MTTPPVLLQIDGNIARVTLNRPEAGNAIDLALARTLAEVAERCARDSTVRCVVLTGAGRLFCAGGDLPSFIAAGNLAASMLDELARTRLTWRDGFYVTYDYDAVDEMTAIHENGGTVLASFAYDDLGRRTGRALANGATTSYGYDAMSRLTSLTLGGATDGTAITLGGYNPAGQIGSRTNSNDAFAWTEGVNASRGYSSNGLNQYTAIAGGAQSYDAKGNLTGSGGVGFAYDTKNELVTAGGNSVYYDPLGRIDLMWQENTLFEHDGGTVIAGYCQSNVADTPAGC